MFSHFRTLYHYRYLLWTWTIRDLKIRYKQSLLGAAWAILQPVALMAIFSLVFSFFVRIPSDGLPYPIFSYAGILPWTLFSNAISFGVPSLVNNIHLITKIYFPREVLSITPIGTGLVDFGLGFIVFLFFLLLYHVPLQASLLWVPLLLLIQVVLMLGVILFASAVNVFYRDVRFVVPLALQIWFYATPVIYPLSSVPDKLKPFYLLNPMVGLIDGFRKTMLQGQNPDFLALGSSAIVSLIIAILAYAYFKHVEWQFADLI